jgi:cobalt/nickel transport system permease protein
MKIKLNWALVVVLGLTVYFWANSYEEAYAMHIMEGFLPFWWVVFWWVITIPFLIIGMRTIQKRVKEHPELKKKLGLS